MKFLQIKKDSFSLISAILFLILGIILLLYPNSVIKFLAYIIGIIFALLGGTKIFTYFKNKELNLYNNLYLGIVLIVVGIIIMFCSGVIEFIVRIIVGGWLLYSGVIKLMLSFNLKSLNFNNWYIPLISSIIMIICGLYTVIVSNVINMGFGIVLIIYSVSEIIQHICIPKNKNPDIIK